MIRLFKHYVPHATLLLATIDLALLLLSAEAGWLLRNWQISGTFSPDAVGIAQLLIFAVTIQLAMISVGVYGVDSRHSMRVCAPRIVLAFVLATVALTLIFFLLPSHSFWRSNLLYALLIAIIAVTLQRLLLGRMLGGQAFKRRVLVLGAGPRAARIEGIATRGGCGYQVVGYVNMNDGPAAVAGSVNRAAIKNLPGFVLAKRASEVVLAIEERRNALPLADLLKIKTTGVQVVDLSTFLERETGRVDLDSLNPSWLIFSDGFSASRRLSSISKRAFDVGVSAAILALLWPVIALTALLVKLESKGPAFFRQRRVGLYGQSFDILKLRSMRQDAEVGGIAVWAQKDDPRVTRVGSIIRKLRIDELPQAWSVLKGEMSFVGPRPERPQFVADLEGRLPYYAERHVVKPGITGWAQINFPYGASIEDARHKLEYDLYYAKNYTPFLDLLILLRTVRVILRPEGAR